MPVNFDALKHPRDKRGRFTKSRTVLASAKDKKAVKEIAAGFKPAKTGDGKAYAGKIADPQQHSVARDFALDAKAINEDLRAGHADAAGVKPMDDAMRPLPDDLVLHRSVPATAFGSVDPQSLQGMKVRDAGFSATQIDPVQPSGDVHMFIAAPKGSRAVVNAETGEVYLDRDSEMVVSRVEKNSAGGHDMYLTVLPKAGAKDDGKTPKAESAGSDREGGKPETEKAAPKPAAEPKPAKADTKQAEPRNAPKQTAEADKPQGEDEFRAALMKQKVPELQAQMRERGLKPGKKRKSELVDALVADEMGNSDKPASAEKTAEKPSAKPAEEKAAPKKAPDVPTEDRVLKAINDIHNDDGSKPGELVSLAKVRDRLGDLDRADVDAALLKLDRERALQLDSDPNRKAISDRAKAAAIRLGGEDMHFLTLNKPAGADGGKDSAEPRRAAPLTGEAALLAAPLSLNREDTHSRSRNKPGLTVEQRTALFDYQGADFQTINARLRNGKTTVSNVDEAHTAKQIKNLDAAMAGSALTHDVAVYRGITDGRKVFGDRMGGNLSGMEWLESGFGSTSADESVVRDFAGTRKDPVHMHITVPAGFRAVQISGLKDIAGYKDESEILLDRGARMRVTADRGVVDGVRVLDVEVVP